MRVYHPLEIDFENTSCKETFSSKLSYIIRRIQGICGSYVGNKKKILFHIMKLLKENSICYKTVIDLFSGSSSVSMLFKSYGSKVISNDLLVSSYTYSKAFVENNSVILEKKDIDYILNNRNSPTPIMYYFSKSGGSDSPRFTDREAFLLDHYRNNINDIDCKYKKSLALANIQLYILDKCFVGGRLNRGQIIADLHYRINHPRNRGQEMSFDNIVWYNYFSDISDENNIALNMDAIECLRKFLNDDIDLIYIDPPYGGQQSDYFGMYNVIESYARGELLSSDNIIHNEDRFTKSKRYINNFQEMLQSVSWANSLLLSYNNDSWVDIDTLVDYISQVRSNVFVKEIDYNYQYRSSENAPGKEYLILAQ